MADDESKLIYVCPLCHRTSVVGASLLGKLWNCRECGGRVAVVIPGVNAATPTSTDLADEPPTPPTPFKTRLGHFLHCDENDLGKCRGDPKSKMKFWTAIAFGRRHEPKPVWLIRIGTLAAVLVGAYLLFELGRIQAGHNIVDVVEERRAFRSEIDGLKKLIMALEEEVTLLETHRDIDEAAYENVEASLVGLQRKIQEQRDAIAFYRGIVSPADGGRGLRVQDLKLTKGKDDREYNVRLVLIQMMQHDRAVKGDVNFSVEGEQEGVATTYTLEQLVPADEDSSWPFSFRYFQDFDRELVLPDGFTPERITIKVRSRTKSIASIEQSYLWQTGQS